VDKGTNKFWIGEVCNTTGKLKGWRNDIMNKKYVVITGDVVESRKYLARDRIQLSLKETLKKVNKKYAPQLLTDLIINRGDEIQGVLKETKTCLLLLEEIEEGIYPLKMRFGVGIGNITTPISKNAGEMDGNCFYRSRDSLERAKKEKQSVIFTTGEVITDTVLNSMVKLIDAIKSDWKEIHYRRIGKYRRFSDLRKVAREENVSHQAVSKTLKKAKYEAVKEAMEAINTILSSCS